MTYFWRYATHYHCRKCSALVEPWSTNEWQVRGGTSRTGKCPRCGTLIVEWDEPQHRGFFGLFRWFFWNWKRERS